MFASLVAVVASMRGLGAQTAARRRGLTAHEKYAECMKYTSGSHSERLGKCCGQNPEALDCLDMYMECKALFDGELRQQYEAIGELPPDWNTSESRCREYCHSLSDTPQWCAFPTWAIILISVVSGWIVISVIIICCWVRKRKKPKPAEPFNPLNEF
jgi:hypothetical protein